MEAMRLIELTAGIVAAYVGHNPVPAGSLPELIANVNTSVRKLAGEPAKPAETLVPAVNPKRSIFPDYIICLEDGKKFKSLKRHLSSDYGLTPEQYREKWGLDISYPMVAPNYSQQRSALAKASGLGQSAHRRAPAAGTRHAVQ